MIIISKLTKNDNYTYNDFNDDINEYINSDESMRDFINRTKEKMFIKDKTKIGSLDYFYSNCLFQSIKHKLEDFNNVKIIKRGSWWELFKLKFPHFCWVYKSTGDMYHFRAHNRSLPFLRQLWFEGAIDKFFKGYDDIPIEEHPM